MGKILEIYKPTHGIKTYRGIYLNNNNIKMKFKSKWELSAIMSLDNMESITDFQTEPFGIPYKVKNRIKRYYPDILINNKILIEIKPIKFTKRKLNQIKFRAGIDFANKHGLKYIIITEKQMGIFEQIIKEELEKIDAK